MSNLPATTDVLDPDLVGPCGSPHCEHGWRRVTDQYLDRIAPWPEPPPLGADADTEAAYEALVAKVQVRRASLANTYYPCRQCSPRAFFRWAGGHFASDHVAEACAECQEGLPMHRRRAITTTGHTAAMAAGARTEPSAIAAAHDERDHREF